MAAQFLFRVLPTSGQPIYRQLVDQARQHVANGRLRVGEYLPSVRQTALELEINPMTVSKAYSLLERDGIVEFVRGQGMRVAAGQAESNRSLVERQKEMLPLLRQVAAEAHLLALSPKQVRSLLNGVFKEFQGK